MADEYPTLTFAEIKKLKVAELKVRLSSLGLPTTGLKADLVARLASFLESTAIHARLKAEKDEKESPNTVGDSHGGNIAKEPSIPQQVHKPNEPSHVSDTDEPVITQVTAAKVVGGASKTSCTDAAGPLVESADKDVGSSSDIDKQTEVQEDAVQVDRGIEERTEVDERMQPEEKEPEIQQEVMTIEEERGVEIQGGDTQTDEVGIEVEPDVTRVETDQTSSSETESSAHEMKQTMEDEQVPVETGHIVPEMDAREPQIINVDRVEPKEDILPKVIEPEQLVRGNKHETEIETEVSQQPTVSVETHEDAKEHQSVSSNEEISVPQPTLPSSHLPKQTPSGIPTYPPSESSSPQTSTLPPSTLPQPPAHQASQIPLPPPPDVSGETLPTSLDKVSTPPRSTTHVQSPARDASPREPTPQEATPPKDTPLDPLAEAKAKARSVVEMRERRLNEESQVGVRGDDSGYDVDHYEQERITVTESRQEKKKKKKKKRKKRTNEQPTVQSEAAPADDEGIEVEYVQETLDYKDPVYAQFASIFETFKLSDKPETTQKDDAKDKTEDKTTEADKKDDDDMDTDSEEEETQKKEEQPGEKVEKLSKKKLKLQNRMSVAQLKQTVHRPDVVEMHDVTAPDPKLLVYLKACRNTVPVPRHWCFKRKFLQGKRGIIKPPFQLPEFIQKTGIMEMREALQEKEDAKNMKAKMREKIRPKMGKIDIDYQKLHDAFFKWQTKPKMTIHGDLYYEGKEFETKLKEKKPGDLSEDLRTALGMPTGQGSNLVPPPWLIAMQRYGPPPSYPNLKIPGLNAPIPEGASFGYHAGGWGKPPVDEHGRPLYGDVFGVQQTDVNLVDDELVDSNLWGELESESEESEESEEESEEEAADQSGLVTPAETGLVTPSGLTSIPAGMETPDMIELRKKKNIEDAMESGSEQPSLYTVLPEKRAGVGGMMMGTSHVYDLATASAPSGARKAPGGLSEGVEVALDPSELELDPAAMQARYDEQLREQQNTQKEDLSDMVAEHAARQQKKRKKTTESGKAAKKYKEFKF